MDQRFMNLAKLLVGYSTSVGKGDLVLLMADTTTPLQMMEAIAEQVRQAGGVMMDPYLTDQRLSASCQIGCTERQLRADAAAMETRLLAADVCIAIRGFNNLMEMSLVPPDDAQRYAKIYGSFVLPERIDNTRWVVTRWPTPAFAQMTGMSTTRFEEFFFRACLADYQAMTQAVVPLVELMSKTDKVRIVGPDTELTFNIKGQPVVPCTGLRNIPDGEVYVGPIRDSLNGTIQYNTPSTTKSGQQFANVRLVFRSGKIVEASCGSGDRQALQKILDTDAGARYVGEFALGINPEVTAVVGETLFDEKTSGTLHLTPGNSYEASPNGNHSGVHWDLVLDQREQHGGGQIFFDDVLVRENGLFIPDELHSLNPAA